MKKVPEKNKKITNPIFSSNIQYLLDGITQEDFAKGAGISQSQVSKYKKGIVPEYPTLEKIGKWINVIPEILTQEYLRDLENKDLWVRPKEIAQNDGSGEPTVDDPHAEHEKGENKTKSLDDEIFKMIISSDPKIVSLGVEKVKNEIIKLQRRVIQLIDENDQLKGIIERRNQGEQNSSSK